MPEPSSADRLIAALAAGKPEAFADLYDMLAARLHKTAATIAGNRDDADDALQELFVTLARDHEKFAHVVDLDAYLFASLRYSLLALSRRRAMERRHLEQLAQTRPREEEAAVAADDGLAAALLALPAEGSNRSESGWVADVRADRRRAAHQHEHGGKPVSLRAGELAQPVGETMIKTTNPFSGLEQRLSGRWVSPPSSAMRLHVVDSVATELAAASSRAGSRPLVLLATFLVVSAGVLKHAGSAAMLDDSGPQTTARVFVNPEQLRQFSDDSAERRRMAEVLTLASSTRLRMLPFIHGRGGDLLSLNEMVLFQEMR